MRGKKSIYARLKKHPGGNRKDYYELYMIAQQVPPAELLSQGALEYPCVCEFEVMAAESVVLFEKADRELQPERLVELPWEPVNAFFIDYARTLGRAWFEGQEE